MNFFANTGIVLIAVLAGRIFLPFFPSFIWALVMAQVVRPLYVRALNFLSPMVAAAVMAVIVTLAGIIPLSFVGGKLTYEAASGYQAFKTVGLKNLTQHSVRNFVDRLPLPTTVQRSDLLPWKLSRGCWIIWAMFKRTDSNYMDVCSIIYLLNEGEA